MRLARARVTWSVLAVRYEGPMHELRLGLYFGLVVNLLVGALLNNGPRAPDAATWLITLGTANELVGVLLVASPELVPRLQRALRFGIRILGRARHRVQLALRRLLKLPGGPQTRRLGTAVSNEIAMPIEATQGGPLLATVNEKLDWLIQQVAALDWRLSGAERQLRELPPRWRADIAKTRAQLESAQAALEQRLANVRIQLRLLGLAYVVLGIVLSWIGNLA
jgi:hypothetical protein